MPEKAASLWASVAKEKSKRVGEAPASEQVWMLGTVRVPTRRLRASFILSLRKKAADRQWQAGQE